MPLTLRSLGFGSLFSDMIILIIIRAYGITADGIVYLFDKWQADAVTSINRALDKIHWQLQHERSWRKNNRMSLPCALVALAGIAALAAGVQFLIPNLRLLMQTRSLSVIADLYPSSWRLGSDTSLRYFDNMHQYMWEKYVRPGSYYTKRNPYECLGVMLRDQQQDYGDIPEYFDKIRIAGLQYSNGHLCVEVKGDFDGNIISRSIDVANGRGMDDLDGIGFSTGMSSAAIVFPDRTQTEIEFSL